MPKQAKGHVRWFRGIAVARIRLDSRKRLSFAMPSCSTAEAAAERARILGDVAVRLRGSSIDAERSRKALELVAGATPRALRNALAVVEELIGGELRDVSGVPSVPTFQELGEDWTSGKLAKRYPDQIRVKRSAKADESRLSTHVYPKIGTVPVDRVTLDACEDIMRSLPSRLTTATRRNIGQLITRLFAIAVYPLRLIERSPLPPRFLPTNPNRKALAHVYPDEDRRLMACIEVPLAYRVLWGFLTREGMRDGEALALTWRDVDLDRGLVRLDKNKTDDPRAWALSPGTAAALKRFREQHRRDAKPDDNVFLRPDGSPHKTGGMSGLPVFLRKHLKLLGLEEERPELFTSTAERLRIRVHDLRGTFVTVSLANGRSESWISDRTGHRNSTMIARYKRTARTFAELELGALLPLDEAIPELRAPDRDIALVGDAAASTIARATDSLDWTVIGPDLEGDSAKRERIGEVLRERAMGFEPRSQTTTTGNAADQQGSDASSPTQRDTTVQSRSNPDALDPVEGALADAIRGATAAGQWDAVAAIARELQARREARAGVVKLSAAREKRRRR